MGNKILVDCGASNGSAIPELKKLYGPFDKIYAFEPNPENAQQIKSNVPEAIVAQSAVYCRYGQMKLYLAKQFDGSTLYPDKLSGGIRSDRFIEVETLDFSDWISNTIKRDDYLVCKMDIEGAEFDVLEHLLATGKACLFRTLLIEWHVSRFPDRWHKRYRRFLIKCRFGLARVTIKSWR